MDRGSATRCEILQAASAEDWALVERLLPRIDSAVEEDADLARAAGLALTELGTRPFDAKRLTDGVGYLEAAWDQGRRDKRLFWRLVWAQYRLGRQADAVGVASEYVDGTRDADERVTAGGFLCMAREVLGEYEAALRGHRQCLSGLGEMASVEAKLMSYCNGHVAATYGRQGASRDWIKEAQALWDAAPEGMRTCEKAELVLVGAGLAADADRGEQGAEACRMAIAYGEGLLAGTQRGGCEDRLSTLTTAGRLQGHMLWLYWVAGLEEKAEAAMEAARAAGRELREGATAPGVDASSWLDAAFTTFHNVGMVCRRFGRREQALVLMKEAEQVAQRPFGPTFYALAALVLEAGGDKKQSLYYLRRIAEDKEWAYGGLCARPQEEFLRDHAFEAVRDDPEFRSVVDALREEASR
jgi:hypothetical protein